MKPAETLVLTRDAGATTPLLPANRVLRNTYRLLSLTLLFSAGAAGATAALQLPHPGIVVTLIGYFGLLFLTVRLRDSGWGLISVFGLTGFMGYTLGPIISHYLAMPNGHQVVMMAMGSTAAIFLGLSAYATASRRDFSFMGGFLMTGIVVAFLAGLGAIFFRSTGTRLDRFSRVRAADGRPDSLPNEPNHSWRRDQLHHGDGDAVRLDLQSVHQLAALAGHRQ